jgi:membrane-bound lytic murein transglycosylase B
VAVLAGPVATPASAAVPVTAVPTAAVRTTLPTAGVPTSAVPGAAGDRSRKAQAAAALAQDQARAAAAKVEALVERYQRASQQVAQGVGDLSRAFALSAGADEIQDRAEADEAAIRAVATHQVRDIYMSGSGSGLIATVLGATSPDDALWRASTADRVLGAVVADTRSEAEVRARTAAAARKRAETLAEATDRQAYALQALQARAQVSERALAEAKATLAQLTRQARAATVAVRAARRIEAAEAAARAAAAHSAGPVSATAIPAEYLSLYRAGAATCPGMPWTLLAAVGQVESGHGRSTGPSSAGAQGPMQFLPGTFASYAVDGGRDGRTDISDPADAIFSAARYLCTLGAAGNTPAGVQKALFGYNHAQWYVDLVLSVQNSIAEAYGA